MKKYFIFIVSLFSSLIFSQKLNLKYCETTPEIIPFEKVGKFGYCDKTGTILIEPKYDKAGTFSFSFRLSASENAAKFSTKEFATVEFSGKKYRIDKKANIVFDYNLLIEDENKGINFNQDLSSRNTVIETSENGKSVYSVVNKNKVVINPKLYDYIALLYYFVYEPNYFIVKKNEKYGIVNVKNEIIIPLEFDSLENINFASNIEDGIIFSGEKNGKKIIVDLCNNIYDIK